MSDFAALAAKASASTEPDFAADAAAPATGEEPAVVHEEESTAHFEPVVQLEEVEVKTHEEDEEILWKMRAKLFIYGETLLNKGTGIKEWVERGIGEVKFLEHKESGFIRTLMRQEKTMKVICNHVVDPRIVLKPNAGSDRSWVWNAYDFAEGSLEEVTFAIRFGKTESATEFKEHFIKAQEKMKAFAPAEGEGATESAAETTTETIKPAEGAPEEVAEKGGEEGEPQVEAGEGAREEGLDAATAALGDLKVKEEGGDQTE
ncbi:unnamed protein product [Discosporangium mesarthrocarpum]